MKNEGYNIVIMAEDWEIRQRDDGVWEAYNHDTEDSLTAPEFFTKETFEFLIRAYMTGLRAGEKVGRYHAQAEIRKALGL